LRLSLETRILGLAALTLFGAAGVLIFSGSHPFAKGILLAAFLALGMAWFVVLLGIWGRAYFIPLENPDRYRGMIEETSDIIHIVSPEGKFLYTNRGWHTALGYQQSEIAGLTLMDVLHPEEREKAHRQIYELMKAQDVAEIQCRFVTKSGETIWVEGNSTCERVHGKVVSRRGIFHNVTEQRAAQKALQEAHAQLHQALEREKEISRTDALTALANRRAFYEAADVERARAARYSRPVTLAYIDLDNFKHVNDSLGHAVGDELLTRVARLLKENLRFTDTAGRLGGDEFAILLPETGAQAAELVLKKLRQILLHAMSERNWPVTFSIGAATFIDNASSVNEMVQIADGLMYIVKKSGKDKIIVVIIGGCARELGQAAGRV